MATGRLPLQPPMKPLEKAVRSGELLHGTRHKDHMPRETNQEAFGQSNPVEDWSQPPESDVSLEVEVFQDIHPTSAFQVEDWKQAKIGRYPRPPGPKIPALSSLRGLRHPFLDDFDDYTDGPTLDVLDPIPDTVIQLAQLSLVYIASRIITAPWTLFKDYGFRLLSDFLQMFWLLEPILVREHLAPVGLWEPSAAFMSHHPPEISRSGHPIIANN